MSGFEFKTPPYSHQLTAFERFKDREFSALFADMGTGKSKVAIDIAAHKFLDKQIDAVLIIAPNGVHAQWTQEQFPVHCSINWRGFVWRSSKASSSRWAQALDNFLGAPHDLMKVLTVNVEAFQSDGVIPTIAAYVKNHKVLTIVDEATRIKNRSAKRTKNIHKLNKYGYRMILTGTPTAKSPFDLWSMMEFLKGDYFKTSYFIFQHRFGIMMQGVNPYNGGRYTTLIDEKTYSIVKSKLRYLEQARGSAGLMPDDYEDVAAACKVSEKNVRFIAGHAEYTRYKRLDELRSLIADDVFSVRKEDCLDLPPKVYERVYVDLTKEQRRIYNDLKTQLIAQYADKELTIQNKVVLTLRLMQVVGGFFPYMREQTKVVGSERYVDLVGDGELIGDTNPKFQAIVDDLEEVPDEQRVIIWAHFVPELKYLYEALKDKYSCCLYYGGTRDEDRKKIVEDFKAGKYKIFIGNAQTAGFGLNLQNATLQYFFSNTFRVEDRLQAEDRSHRIGVKGTVVYKDIIARNTVDEKVFKHIAAGRDLNDYFKQTSLRDLLADEEADE